MNNSLTKRILKLIREYIKANKISMSEFGRQSGVSKAWLSRLKNYDANLSLDTAESLLKNIGYKLEVVNGSAHIFKSRLTKYASKLAAN